MTPAEAADMHAAAIARLNITRFISFTPSSVIVDPVLPVRKQPVSDLNQLGLERTRRAHPNRIETFSNRSRIIHGQKISAWSGHTRDDFHFESKHAVRCLFPIRVRMAPEKRNHNFRI
jgi:hypothetical protein